MSEPRNLIALCETCHRYRHFHHEVARRRGVGGHRQLLGEVNQKIRGLAANVDPHDDSKWEFVCECDDPGCTETVGVSLALYDDLKDADVPLLAPGHALARSA